ncbi:cation-translocating P-type ATPase [Nocardia aurantiaca]|uniref:HAD-IC family P-type ATPase n=1 Tax=Nocardia aurantiaca TaxID=2675850 RepID=A0A6I3L7B4_9NOCA|nr:cation-translocating P-type ATPase [Nocardia aurantiaca]MTE16860.1 HAD-IC family P-type ATPase [Nocardia aurantiaca]
MPGIRWAAHFVTGLAVDTVRAVGNEIAGRQTWSRGEHAHIEAKGVHRTDAPPEYAAALRHTVGALDGVRWAAVNGVLGDVIVEFDPRRVSVARLRAAVAAVEREFGMDRQPRDRPMHPGGFEPVFDELLSLGGDLLGATVGLVGRIVPPLALPPETIAAVHAVDLVPGLRQGLEARFGAVRVDVALALAGSVVSAAAHTPLFALADAGLRAAQLPAALARRHTWDERAPELAAHARQAAAAPAPPPGTRPVPLPPGPVERYARQVGIVALGGAAALLPMAGTAKAARAVSYGAPRAARMGAAAFAAELGRMLAARGILVRDPEAVDRLDRIDTVVIDAEVLVTADGMLHPLAEAIISAAHAAGRVVVITPRASEMADRLGADDRIGGGPHLAASVRRLQRAGHVVALIASHNASGLAAADCAIGVLAPGRTPPWAADILCGPELSDVWLLLQAIVPAKRNSEFAVRLALLGSSSGALLGLVGPARGGYRRGSLPVGLSALIAVAGGIWSVDAVTRRRPPPIADVTPWHAMPVEEALAALRSGLPGLSDEQAAGRHTSDVDSAEPSETLWRATVSEFDTPLTAPLAAGAGVSAASGSVLDAGLVTLVMAGNAVLGAVQRIAAGRAVRRLADIGALQANLRRRNEVHITPASELVAGDIVLLHAGDAVPADCRLVDADHLEIDESSLTGESLPVPKDPAPVDSDLVAERTSMLYAGTTVVAGSGTALVTAVGRATEAGRSGALADSGESAAGVETRLNALTKLSMRVAAGAGGAVLGIGLLRGRVAEAVGSAVALAVAAVPEGLPFVATVAQLAAARRLSHRNVLVRTPRTLEALGRVDTVCFDKTGTLTEAHIELRRVSDGFEDEPLDALTPARHAVLAAALRATPVDPLGRTPPHPTDRAVERGAHAARVDRADGEPDWVMVRELPFEPGRGFHAVLGSTDDRHLISVKGAPEIVLPRCTAFRRDGGGAPLTDAVASELQLAAESLAEQGFRVLAVAERAASQRSELDSERIERLEFLGLLCLADPIRPTAAAAVRDLRAAGVDAVMLTGDHPQTAVAIATELGLRTSGRVITGTEVEASTEAELAALVAETAVFARVSPVHKAAIVRALRHAGHTVAVTGDGANDAPAIRLADVGIALGPKSTPAAKQAADIVVTDERIETIVDAVIESRAMWRSVRDSVSMLVGGNLGEIAFTLGSSILSARPALNARQLLAVNLLTDLLPALVVAARPPRDVTPAMLLSEGPDSAVGAALRRDVTTRALSTTLAASAAWLAALVVYRSRQAGTVGFAALVGTQLAQTARSAHGDPLVMAAGLGSAAALFALVQFPPTSYFFGCRPLGPLGWGIVAISSVAGAVATGTWQDRRNPESLPSQAPTTSHAETADTPERGPDRSPRPNGVVPHNDMVPQPGS